MNNIKLEFFNYYYIVILKAAGRYSSDIVLYDLVALPEPKTSDHIYFKHIHSGVRIRVPVKNISFLNDYTIEVNHE